MKEKGPAATGALEEDSCYAMDRSRGGPGPQSWGAVAVTCGMRIQPPAFCGLCGDGLASCRAGVTTELPPVLRAAGTALQSSKQRSSRLSIV
jgi:hypothetical protein